MTKKQWEALPPLEKMLTDEPIDYYELFMKMYAKDFEKAILNPNPFFDMLKKYEETGAKPKKRKRT